MTMESCAERKEVMEFKYDKRMDLPLHEFLRQKNMRGLCIAMVQYSIVRVRTWLNPRRIRHCAS